jgi:hypothetical protein
VLTEDPDQPVARTDPREGRIDVIGLDVIGLDVIDVVVDLALACVAALLAGVLFLRGRHGGTVVARGRPLRRPMLWAAASAVAGVVLLLRVVTAIVPAGWRGAAVVATLVAAAICIAVLLLAVARSRRP